MVALPSGGGFGCGMRVFSVAGGADPGRGAERLSERFLSVAVSGWVRVVNQRPPHFSELAVE